MSATKTSSGDSQQPCTRFSPTHTTNGLRSGLPSDLTRQTIPTPQAPHQRKTKQHRHMGTYFPCHSMQGGGINLYRVFGSRGKNQAWSTSRKKHAIRGPITLNNRCRCRRVPGSNRQYNGALRTMYISCLLTSTYTFSTTQ